MEDIRSVLSIYKSKLKEASSEVHEVSIETPTLSEIPDVFFDEILPYIKLSRCDILVLMMLYRQVWSKPNLYRSHGIGPLNSYAELSKQLHISQDDLLNSIKTLEAQGLLGTVRAGQYFVRKFFTEDFDAKYGQHYEF